jgi:superfamily II DNA or RNA helicase
LGEENLLSSNERDEHKAIEFLQPTPQRNLREYQEEIRRKIVEWIDNRNEDSAIITLPTGAGKTAVTMSAIVDSIAQRKISRIIWVAEKKELCLQARSAFIETFHLRYSDEENVPEIIAIIDMFDASNPDENLIYQMLDRNTPFIVIATPDQLSNRLNTRNGDVSAMIGNISLMVVDEAHRAMDEFNRIWEEIKPQRKLGITATPRQNYYEFFRRIIRPNETFNLNENTMEQHLQREGVLSRTLGPEVWAISEYMLSAHNLETEEVAPSESHLDPHRMTTTIENIQRILNAGEVNSILVFIGRVEQGRFYSAILNRMMGEDISECVWADGMSRADRRKTVNRFRNGNLRVLFNVDLLREGFDAPNIDCIILGTNIQNDLTRKQMIGRGLRGEASENGTETCKIIEIIGTRDLT